MFVSEQEVVSQCKKLTKKNKEHLSDLMDTERRQGLKALSRDRRDRLEAYQHLFYLLQVRPGETHTCSQVKPMLTLAVCVFQTQPLYLAQVIFLMPQTGSTSFMERLLFSLFNFGSDRREAYLLLQLFTEALRCEVR